MQLSERYSVGMGVGPVSERPAFTLLDPAWMLPPLDWLDTAAALDETHALQDQVAQPDSAAGRATSPSGEPFSYSLSNDLSAQFRYRRSYLFDTLPSDALRDEGAQSFSNRPDRDVVGLNMSWRLAGSTVGLGYQIESARGSPTTDLGLSRFLPGNQQATHALTLGLTREWGRAEAPQLVEAPVLIDEAPATAADAPAAP